MRREWSRFHYFSFSFQFLILLTALRAAPLVSRQVLSCITTVDGPISRKVLQIDGYVEDVLRISVCTISEDGSLPSAAGYAVTPLSSNREVLPLDNIDLRTAVTSPCLNVTALLVFDAMVGSVIVTISARIGSSSACIASVSYIVAGLTLYSITNNAVLGTRFVSQGRPMSLSRPIVPSNNDSRIQYLLRSGSDNQIEYNFRDILNNPIDSFRVRVQFPDGSSSTTQPLGDITDALRGLLAHIPVDASSPVRFDTDECRLITVDNFDEVLQDGGLCGAALGVRDELLFGIRYLPYKDGIANISLMWPAFTFNDDDLSDEEYYTTVSLSVVGEPPPLVEELSAPDAMYRAGGQLITVVFDNAEGSTNRVLRLGNYSFPEINGSFQRLENGLYKTQFYTLPGKGTEIPWRIEVSYGEKESKLATSVDGDIRPSLSYVTEPLKIASLQPPWGSDEETLTIEGFFDGFDPSRDGHSIFIGNKSVSEMGIVPFVDRERGFITLIAPNRTVAGSAYEYPIRVTINDESTEGFIFAYVPDKLIMSINVYGGSYDSERGEYLLGTCEFSRYLAVLSSGVAEPAVFQWTLLTRIDGVVVDLLEGFSNLSISNSSLTLQASVFRGRAGVFVLSASCVIYGQTVTADVTLRKTMTPVIGVTLPHLPVRSLMIPDLPIRIDAIVTLPSNECYRLNSDVVYVWTYNNISSVFSHSNVTAIDVSLDKGKERVRPTRLGRELLIPQSQLAYGNFTISLLVYVDDDSFISGESSTTLEVTHAPLQPIIGFGATEITHSSADDLNITGARSKNPDAPLDPAANVTRYVWGCALSFTHNNSDLTEPCTPGLLPASNIVSFIVSARAFQSVLRRANSRGDVRSFFVIYSLKVGTSSFTSASVSLRIEVIDWYQSIAMLTDLTVTNGRGTMVDINRVRYYDDLVIVPNGINVAWSIHVISPKLDSNFFGLIDNLIISDGFYNPQLRQPQALPIGIKAGALRPARTYDIALNIESAKDGKGNGTVLIRLRTVDAPKLLLSSLTVTTGDTNTLFTAAARVNLDTTDSFSFFFFLVMSDGDEICLDGCSGRSVVQFLVVEDGQFRVLVRLRDVEGTSVLDEQFFPSNISITSLGSSMSPLSYRSSLESVDTRLKDMHRYGDHGAVQLLSSSLARQARFLVDKGPLENTVTVISSAVQLMRSVVYNSVPTAFTSRSYIQTANLFARLAPQLILHENTLSALVAMVDDALIQVPVSEALDVDQELLLFYNLTARHYLRPFVSTFNGIIVPSRYIFFDLQLRTGRSTSKRQVQKTRMNNQTLLIDYYVFMQKHVSLALSRDAVCGTTKSVSTAVERGVDDINSFVGNTVKYDLPPAQAASRFVESFGRFQISLSSTISIAVICSLAQTNLLNGQRSQILWRERNMEDEDEEDNIEDGEASKPINTPSFTIGYDMGEYSAPFVGDTIQVGGVSVDLMPSEPQTQKKLIIMMETMDYSWVAGLVQEDMKTATSVLITINTTRLTGNALIPFNSTSSQLYIVNTTVPRVGLTEGKGCIGAQGFYEEGRVFDRIQLDASKQRERKFGVVRADMSTDNSSTMLMKMKHVGVIGAVLTNCPRDARLPSISLPKAKIEFPYGVIGVALSVSTAVTIGWTSSSASYASFTGSAIWK